MFLPIVQSLSALILAGLGCYVVFVSARLQGRHRLQRALVGLIFGILAAVLTANTYIMEQVPGPVYAIAGPLLFAGYLGGPIGGAVAAALILTMRFVIGGPFVVADLYIYAGYITGGLLVARFWPARPWPVPPGKAIGMLVLVFLFFRYSPPLFLVLRGIIPLSPETFILRLVALAVAGVISILLIWWMLRIVAKVASRARQNAQMARRLELAMQHAGMGMFDHAKDADDVLFDAGMIKVYGLDHEPGLVPMADWADRIHPDDLPRLMQAIRATWANENTADHLDFRAIHPKDGVRYIRAQWVSDLDADGNPVRFIGTHADLTDIRTAEQDHMQATNQLASIAENLPGAMFSFTTDGKELGHPSYVSPGCREIWGYSPDEIHARPELLPESLATGPRQELLDLLTESIRSCTPVSHRHQITRRDGGTRWLDMHGSSTPVGNGQTRLDVISLDVTREVEQAEARAETESRLMYALDHINGAAITYTIPAGHEMPGPDDTIHFFNKDSCFKIWGVEAEEAEADVMAIWTLMTDEDQRARVMQELAQATRDLQQWHSVMSFETRQGKRIWIEERGHPTRLEDGSTQYFSLILDVTSRIEQQHELERQTEFSHRAQKQQSIGQLTGGVAHDFNNLLAVILGNLELLRDDERDPDRVEMIDAGIRATQRGADLTRSMLAFAKKARLVPRPFNLNTLVSETRNWAGRTLPENIEIETSLLAGLWTIEADPASTEAALLNLIVNARDAMADGGKLTIETANVRIEQAYVDARSVALQPGRYTMLAVSDTGHGIPEAVMSQIFEPFYTTKGPGAGSGLGLSMILGFMEQSGGTVQVYSEPGKGTTFKLYFPAKYLEHGEITATEPKPQPASLGDRRILLVEDEEDVRVVLATAIEKSGYHVTQARTGDEALAIFKANPGFDLLVTDIVMPGNLQGTGLSKALREYRPSLPVVFMSGYASEATVHGNSLRPEDIRLMKPVQRSDFLAAVAQALTSAN